MKNLSKKAMKSNLMLALSASLALFTTACAHSREFTREPAQRSNAKAKIYTFESDASGFNTKTYFYDNGEEVVAFDTQFTSALAQKALDYLRTQTAHPLTYAVITHPNPDKFNGMAIFQAAGAQVIASERTVSSLQAVHAYKQYYFVEVAKMFTNANYPKLGTVDLTFQNHYALTLRSGEKIELSELAHPGVSSNQTVALIPAMKVLIVGDLVHHEMHAWLEGGIVNGKPVPTLDGWIADLNELETRYGKDRSMQVLGGRGALSFLHDAVRTQIQYLRVADRLVGQYAKTLGSASPDYIELQKEFEREFPHYGLSYLIGYGVYGLLQTK